ncbi:MAG: nucleotidyltransferase domain-containing protein [Ignisphaera sp.]
MKSIGEYIAKRINIIKECRNVANGVAQIIKQITPGVEVYVFGSAVAGRVTGSSDIDILVV